MNGDPQEKSALSPVKRAYLKLEELQAELAAINKARREPIAIVGVGCRFPGGSHDPEAFWRFLHQGRDAVREVPSDRWNIDEYYDPNPGTPGKMYTRNGAFLDRVDLFDPQFFGIAPREAIGMDPQQRLLLEVAWEALERSGIAPDKLSGSRTGVFVGLCTSDYADMQIRSQDMTKLDAYHASGIAHSIASGRLSYVLGLQGPCITVDTACSSSLVAIHLACQSLRGRECNMALAGGVSVILSPDMFIALSKASMLAADGRCKTFDASADGYARGEGCGVVVLKRLSDASADGDSILALIRGSAINQDGPSSGLTAPNGPAQTSVIRDALANGGVRPEEISYVETHGTGTSLGDPIEVQALAAAYCERRPPDRPLLIGALKSNIGHLEGAAGVAGLIKLVLSMQHREIPPSLHVNRPNPFIPWADLAVKVTTQLTPWELPDKSRLAGLSSFGFSGTNAHLVVQEAPALIRTPAVVERPMHLLALSAKSGEALNALTDLHQQQWSALAGEGIGNICHTANSGRAHWQHRAAILAGSMEQMGERLGQLTSGTLPAGVYKGQAENSDRLKIAFLFTGQGAQYVGMARELYETQPAFKRVLDQCNEILRDELHPSLLSVLYPEAGQPSPLDETAYTQPALFSLEYALSQLWMSWGIQPGAVMGHSVGEYVAACVAGVFSLEEGLKLIAARGSLMQNCERGLMAAVSGDELRVAAELEGYRDRVAIAALNGPANTVISGRSEAVEELLDKFARAGMKTKRLTVSHAFHSPLMDPMLEAFAKTAAKVNYRPPRVAVVSNLSGRMASSEEISRADYWVRHAREAVNFAGSMRTLHEKGFQVFLEIGPSPTLLGMGAKCLPEGFGIWLPSLRKGRGDWQQVLESLATLYIHGAEVDWKEFDRSYQRRRVVLPTYPFQRKRYWTEMPKDRPLGESSSVTPRKTLAHPLLHRRLDSPFLQGTVFESDISLADLPWLNDHQAFGQRVFPATAYLEMSLAAAGEAFGSRTLTLLDMDIREAMTIEEGAMRRVQIAVMPLEGDAASFQLASLTEALGTGTKWKVHAAGKIRIDPAGAGFEDAGRTSLANTRSRCGQEIPVETYHQQFAALGMYLGPSFKGLKRLWLGSNEVLAQIRLVPEIASEARLYRIHPAMLDPCLQPFAAAALRPEELAAGGVIYMPVALESYRVYREPGENLWSHIVVTPDKQRAEASTTVKVDVTVMDDSGAVVAKIEGLSLRRVDRQALAKRQDKPFQDWLYELKWREAPLPEEKGLPAAVSVPSPVQLTEELRLSVGRYRSEPALAAFASLFPSLEALSTQYVYQALQQLGWTMQKQERFTTESKAANLRVPKRYFRLFARMLEMLHEDGILRRIDGEWQVHHLPPLQDPEISFSGLLELYPDCAAELKLTARCGQHLSAVIKGECEPLDLLFPDGSSEDIEKLYMDSPSSRFYNKLLADAIRGLLSRVPKGRPIRILEVGGGTGSSTASVLPELAAQGTEYVFTDVTPLFVSKARKKFGAFPFVSYRSLDIEKDPLAQGFEAHAYDIVIAANVLHATADLRRTLGNVRTLLASEGVLFLLEGTRPLRFGDLIVGLTEGWWKFEDTGVRPSHALVANGIWRTLLADSGFSDVVISPEGEPGGVLANQSLILSQVPRLAGAENTTSTAAKQSRGRWIVFADRSGLGESLRASLQSPSGACVTVFAGGRYEALGGASYQIDPGRPEDFQQLLRDLAGTDQSPFDGAVYLWPLDCPNAEIADFDDLNVRIREGCKSLLHLVKALVSDGSSKVASLWIVTRGAVSANSSGERVALAQVPVSAMGSTIALEFPELLCSRIDLDPRVAPDEAGDLAREIQSKNDEDLIAFRNGRRHVARLSHFRSDSAPEKEHHGLGGQQPYRLQTSAPGMLDCLTLQPLERRQPGPGEVEIAILATGLIFRDVLMALGRYAGASNIFGNECVGRIVALGDGVGQFQTGQRVIVMGPGSFASHMTLAAHNVLPVPDSLSDEEATSIPSAFLTAYYALCYLARMAPGDLVLIHAAAGGVGLAAVQLAQRTGAEVFATAGSQQKRDYLKSLGVAHVMDSRSLDFAAEILRTTGGKGVDIVLNSLAGEFIEKSFSVMAAHGRFLEIGSTEIWDQARVAQLNRDILYHPINLAATFRESPGLLGGMLADLMKEFGEGRLKPLPIKVFPVAEVAGAFRYMSQAKHIGKIVVSHVGAASGASTGPDVLSRQKTGFDADGSYWITGGLAGLGLLVAQWMVEQGARHVVLTGRSEPSEQALESIRRMEQKGAQVVVARGDVSDRSHLDEVFSKFGSLLPPLRGIVHSAGALDDGVLLHQSWERFQKVFAAKVAGSWHLHALTKGLPLDFFVMFSSAVSLLGSAGQGSHVAACAFEDALAYYRRALGLPALTIDWGPWAETGAATRGTIRQRVQLQGFQLIQPDQGLRVLEDLLRQDRTRAGVLAVDWRQFIDSLPRRSALLSELTLGAVTPSASAPRKPDQTQDLLRQLNQAAHGKRQKLLMDYVERQSVKVLGLDTTQHLDPKQPLSELGLDSLMAVELRSMLSAELGLSRGLPATLVFDYPTIAALTQYLAEEVLLWEKPEAPPQEPLAKEEDSLGILDRIEALSDEEVDRRYDDEKAVK